MKQILLAVLLCSIHNFHCTDQTDSSSFLIYNMDHDKCVTVLNASSVEAAPCNPSDGAQRFRWASEFRLLSISQKLCLGAQSQKDWVKVLLYPCDEKSELQHWECKNDTLFGLKGLDLHLNYGNNNEKNMMVYNSSGGWSRWQIYSTTDNLCSRGYQELYTINGNGFGAPCQFPFKFNQKWYAECTHDGRSDGHLWCATETDFDKDNKWGFCTTKSDTGWDTDPVTGVLYQWNLLSALTWHQARKSCQQQGADLLSIVELHEQTYMTGRMVAGGAPLWIGLNSLDFESGWQWSNGNPFRYFNWAPGHPSFDPGLNCAVVKPTKAFKWESTTCSKKLGYICQKGNSTRLTPVNPEGNQPSFCTDHWVPYAGHCYYLQRTKKTWREALSACHKEGGDLASIHNIEEHSFVISQLGYLPTDQLWIGLNDERKPRLFEWSDRSDVTFALWKVGEPTHNANLQEDCVLISGKEGKWSDHMCEKETGYICKKKASSRPSGTHDAVDEGCKPGWTRYSAYCYYVGLQTKTFDEAKDVCVSESSYLADVASRYENAFLISLVGLRPEKYFWIGLSNMVDRDNFVWTNTNNVRFTHFNVGMPDRKLGCVAMATGTFAGLWDVISCTSQQKYICKHQAEGVLSTVAPPTTPPLSCPSEWRPLGSRNFCYKVYRKSRNMKKTWFQSRDFCRAIGGDLVSIHSGNDLNSTGRHELYENAWIGISALNPNVGFVWSDGSKVSYEHWESGEPNNLNNVELCGEISYAHTKQWNDCHCESYNNWICQIRKGVVPNAPPEDQPEYNVTHDGWIEYNDIQYYINFEHLAMDDARAYCKKNFCDLAVITGESERIFIWKQISQSYSDLYYIGMTVDLDKSFQWMDGTPVSYVAWDRNEPGFLNNDENCVAMARHMGFWHDINCGSELPSVCKRSRNISINATVAPTPRPKGGCPSGWMYFQGKCYKMFGESPSVRKTWHEARTYCINLGGNLVSILSEQEQALLSTMMIDASTDVWIGFNDIASENQFLWTDGKGIYFTNWANGQPVSSEGYYDYEYHSETQVSETQDYDCTMMLRSPLKLTGRWKMEQCTKAQGFICKRNTDPQINFTATTELPGTYQKLGNDSFKVVAQKMKWDEARRQCKADDAELASVVDPVTQAFITLHIHQYNEPAWIGLNSNMTAGYFRWTDNWWLSYSNWGSGEPKNNLACVYIDIDGKWKTASCDESHYSLCKRSQAVPPTDPPQFPGMCPESNEQRVWIPFRGHCYAFTTEVENWAHAAIECVQLGGALLSIGDPVEADFIQKNVEILQDSFQSVWIGMFKTRKGDWLWIDTSVVDYTNWMAGKQHGNQDCVVILSHSSKWSTANCHSYNAYICKMAKVVPPTAREPKKNTEDKGNEGHQLSVGIIVTVVLIILIVLGFVGFFLCKRQQTIILARKPFRNIQYFNSNPSWTTTTADNVNLVGQTDLADTA